MNLTLHPRTLRHWLAAAALLGLVLYLALHPIAGPGAALFFLLLPVTLFAAVLAAQQPFAEVPSVRPHRAPTLPLRFQRPPPSLHR